MILIVDFSKQSDKIRLYESLKTLKPVAHQIMIKVDRDSRSAKQNKYYWGVVVKLISDYTGFETDEVREFLKCKFLKYEKALPSGEVAELIASTTKLDTKEFEEFMEKVRAFAAQELDLIIPLPNEAIEV